MAAPTPPLTSGPVREFEVPGWGRFLRPLVDAVAGFRAGVLAKLLTGFLVGAVLLLALGVLDLVTVDRMSREVAEIELLHRKASLAHQMELLVVSQSHAREVSILAHNDAEIQTIAADKQAFHQDLQQFRTLSSPPAYLQVLALSDRFDASSARVLALYESGQLDAAGQLHITEEHPISDQLQAAVGAAGAGADQQAAAAQAAFDRDRRLISIIVAAFSVVSLLLAVLLGLVLSWAFVRPVRRVEAGLARLAAGDFNRPVSVPNRDELGALTRNLNHTSGRLRALYAELRELNQRLHAKVQSQVQELDRASGLRRYLSPQIADTILAGDPKTATLPKRRNLTVLYADLCGFSALAEESEPDELVDRLNEYLTAMTDAISTHGGTLDRYLGRAILAFFGDPVPQEDHAERALRTALDMRDRLAELRSRWAAEVEAPLELSVGISSGYMTVGSVGSPSRLEYTVVGGYADAAVQLAGRARPGQILATDRALARARAVAQGVPVFTLRIPGLAREVKVFEVAGAPPAAGDQTLALGPNPA